jgi:hypothetical protein
MRGVMKLMAHPEVSKGTSPVGVPESLMEPIVVYLTP